MRVFITPEAQKQLKHIDLRGQAKVRSKLCIVEKDPFAGKRLKGTLKELYSFRAWPYRIIYLINKRKEVWVVSILHRQGAYR